YNLWQVLFIEHEIYGLGKSDCPDFIKRDKWLQLDLTNPTETYQTVTNVNPELVIHAAALTNVDNCELNPEKAYLNNTLATRNVALACQRFDSAMLYISADYVFAGEKNTPYREDDMPNPINTYGKTKYNGEFYVRHLLNKFYIIRTA
ncbi:MAG TPA: dTDP-4-dehydrorhamnose reductase, partial [Elusimicrobia bacterium]|nr:dTDP-4-dehydrorhamnose reductase [Elusimicrobiota bacterium]